MKHLNESTIFSLWQRRPFAVVALVSIVLCLDQGLVSYTIRTATASPSTILFLQLLSMPKRTLKIHRFLTTYTFHRMRVLQAQPGKNKIFVVGIRMIICACGRDTMHRSESFGWCFSGLLTTHNFATRRVLHTVIGFILILGMYTFRACHHFHHLLAADDVIAAFRHGSFLDFGVSQELISIFVTSCMIAHPLRL